MNSSSLIGEHQKFISLIKLNQMKKSTILLGLLFHFVCAFNLRGQHDTLPEQIQLNEIVISYNKTEERRNKIPQPIEIIDSKAITRAQSQTTADLIAQTGSVMVQKSQQGGGSPVIRGFEASRVLLVVDGVRMNNLIYRSGHLQNILTVDQIALDRAEILFGPSSTVYGSDALGGVIHLFTKKPMFSENDKLLTKVMAQSRYSSVNSEFSEGVDINLGGKRFASRTVISYSRFGDVRGGSNQNPFYTKNYGTRDYYVDRINGQDSIVKNSDRFVQVGSAYTQYNVMQKFGFKQSDRVLHQLNMQFSNSSNVPRYDRLTDLNNGNLKWAEWHYGPQERFMAAYDLNITSDGFFHSTHLGLNYQAIQESRHQRRFNNDTLQNRIENVGVAGLNFEMRHHDERHEVQIGIDGQYNMLVSTANQKDVVTNEISPLDTRYPDGNNSMLNAAFYLSHIWKINREWNLTDGIRVGYASLNSTIQDNSFFNFPTTSISQSNPVYSGSLGVVHHPSDDLKMSFLVSTGYRVPNVDDLSKVFESSSKDSTLIVPNPNLKPEKTINAEWGISNIFNQRTRLENTIYYTSFFDAIQTAPFQFNGKDSMIYDGSNSAILANQNLGRAYIYGFSSTLKTQATKELSFLLSMNYTYGRVKTDTTDIPLDHISPFMAKAQVLYSGEKITSEFFVLYNGWKKLKDYSASGEDNEDYAPEKNMPAWFTANWRLGFQATNRFLVQAGIENIFDTQYRVFASGINAPGRNIYLTLRYSL
jgi:hemoglobin/transferrin/lactoferrin receptor protein